MALSSPSPSRRTGGGGAPPTPDQHAFHSPHTASPAQRTTPQLVSSVSSALLPARFADAVEGERSFAQARLGSTGASNSSSSSSGSSNNNSGYTGGSKGPIVCALVPGRGGGGGGEEGSESLVVLTGEGHFYQFGLDLVNVRRGGVNEWGTESMEVK